MRVTAARPEFAPGVLQRLAQFAPPSLDALPFAPVLTPVVSNLAVQPYPDDPGQYAMLLHAQIFNPVRWTETVQYFNANGVTHLLEIGPGKVLRMLTAKISREIKTMNIEYESELDALASWLAEVPAA